jgi:hypothetical protein
MTKVYFTFLLFLPVLSFSQISMIELDAKKVPEPLARDTVVDNWNSLQPGFRLLNQQAKEMLYWTNYCRNNPQKFWDSAALPILKTFPKLKKTEAESMRLDILHAGQLPMFSLNANLITTAQAHAFDIARRKAPLSHNSTNGADFGTRMKNAPMKTSHLAAKVFFFPLCFFTWISASQVKATEKHCLIPIYGKQELALLYMV